MNVGDIIRHNARKRADEEALITRDRRLTYEELNTWINRFADALHTRGIGHGDRVAVIGENCAEYVFVYHALAKLGGILVPLNYWQRDAELQRTLDHAGVGLLLCTPQYEEAARRAAADLDVRVVGLIEGGSSQLEVLEPGDPTEPTANVAGEDPHMILYTSGTTGSPKGAVLSHRRTVDDTLAMALGLRLRPDDTFLNFFPPFHVGNWDHMKLYHLVGARVVLLPQFDPAEALRAIENESVTCLLGVPAMLREVLSHPNFDEAELGSVRLLYYGAYDPSGLMLEVADVFGASDGRAEMFHTYGLTEAGPFVALCDSADLFRKFGSIGRAMPGVEIALLDVHGDEVPVGTPGEICIRGPRMTGYWNDPERTAEALRGGWLHTGDVAVADEEGFLRIVDRIKDSIRTGGQNVYSKEVEDTILLDERIADCAVIGVPDPDYEEKVVAVVVPANGVALEGLTEDVRQQVRQHMAGYNVPKVVHVVSELPKNTVGKTLKHELRSEYGSMFDAAPHGGDPSSVGSA